MRAMYEKLSKRSRGKAIGIVMVVMIFFEFLMLYLFRAYWLEPARIFHVSVELVCMAVLLVFYRLHLNQVKPDSSSDRLFNALCVLLYFCLFLDVISWLVDGSKDFVWLNCVSNGGVLILEVVHGMLFCRYVIENIEPKTEGLGKLRRFLEIIMLLALIARIALVCSGVYFTINENSIYEMTAISTLSYFFIPIISLFVCGIAAGAGLKPGRLAAFLSYPLSSLFMVGLAFVNVGYANSLTTLSLSVILIYCLLFADTNRENADLSSSVRTYLALDLSEEEQEATACGKSHVATILFCILHGFPTDMESMEPEDAVIMLNRFYNETASLIEKHNGKLLEYPGNSLFCIFSGPSHVTDAVNAAQEIMASTEAINRFNAEDHYPAFRPGIGISTGEVIVGNIGNGTHMRYSCIGRTVNLASRAASSAKEGMIVLTENTLDADREHLEVESAGMFIPKGLSKPIRIYSVTGEK